MPPKSKAQAGLMGAAIASPKVRREHGISEEQAREFMRGAKVKDLPAKKRGPSESYKVSKRSTRTGKPAKKFSLFRMTRSRKKPKGGK